MKKEAARRNNIDCNSTSTCKHILAAELAKSIWKVSASKTDDGDIHQPFNYNNEVISNTIQQLIKRNNGVGFSR